MEEQNQSETTGNQFNTGIVTQKSNFNSKLHKTTFN